MTQPNIRLRRATIADLPIVLHWDEQPHVIEADLDGNWDWDTELLYEPAWREQLIAELDERPIGFIQIIDPALEETHYWGEVPQGLRAIDIWIGEAADLGKGYGTLMMHQAIERCFADPSVNAILIDPLATNVRAHRFYKRLGFRFVEQKRLGDDDSDCFVYELNRERYANHLLDQGPFYHGTKADLQVGDLLTAGFESNYHPGIIMNHIYFTALVNGAGLAAELAPGDGRERVYIVEPTGRFENDPNVTDKKFPGNPTRSYRSREPLKIVGEVTDWVRLTPEALQTWRENLAKLRAGNAEIIN